MYLLFKSSVGVSHSQLPTQTRSFNRVASPDLILSQTPNPVMLGLQPQRVSGVGGWKFSPWQVFYSSVCLGHPAQFPGADPMACIDYALFNGFRSFDDIGENGKNQKLW